MNPDGLRTWIEINRSALIGNLRYFERAARPAAVMAVIKSNAYGHGLLSVARIVAGRSRETWLGVDSIVEALRLRREGISNPILVFGYTLPGRIAEAASRSITLTFSHFEGLRALAALPRRPAFHLKIDSGMHRHGFQPDELPALLRLLHRERLRPAGVYTHLAAADRRRFSELQLKRFASALAALCEAGTKPVWVHANKTEGILRYPEANYNLTRLGIGLYGYVPGGAPTGVRPVMTWKTMVAEVKSVSAGEPIGYDLAHRFSRRATIAVLPVGYWHGYDRGLSNVGRVQIRGQTAPVRGRVCMDITMVETTRITGVRVGDEVTLLGSGSRRGPDAEVLARAIGTTAYEVLTRVNPLIRRIAV